MAEGKEWVVRNADTDEEYTVEEAVSKFKVLRLPADDKRVNGNNTNREETEEDDYYFDAKDCLSSRDSGLHSEGATGTKVSIPDGARLSFGRITAVGTAKDPEDKSIYSVYYLEVKCNVASPTSWVVYRRYSQFRRLSDLLRSEAFSVPVLPPKRLLNTFSIDFVRQRKTDLEAWLHNLAEQHSMHTGAKDPQTHHAYRQFLTEDANLPPQPLTRVFPEHIDSASSSSESKSDSHNSPSFEKTKVGVDDFELVKVIGKGSFGKVTLVMKKDTQKMYAMKVLSKPNIIKRKQVEHTRTERRVLGTINHPFIVKLHYAFQTDQKLYFVLDYAAGGELFFHLSRMKKFPEHLTRFYCAEISLALDTLHAQDVVYRDLKPENILLDGEGHIKLADFGLAKEGVHEAAEGAHSLCGTPEYLSPEVLDRQGHGTAVDWWNLGMVTYEMLTGLPPWYTTDREKLFDRLRHAPLKFPFYINRPAASLIQGLLNRNPLERLGAGGGAEVRQHPFFASMDWEALLRREVAPPFNPCRNQDIQGAENFEKEFTNMPLMSVDEGSTRLGGGVGVVGHGDSEFLNFTFEEESFLTQALESRWKEKDSRRK